MKNYEHMILNALLDKYESSRTFAGTNQVNQRFTVKPEKLEPAYADDAEYMIYAAINAAAETLQKQHLVSVAKKRNGTIREVQLNTELLGQIYSAIKREPKKQKYSRLKEILQEYKGYNDVLDAFIEKQLERIAANREPVYAENPESFENLLKGLAHIYENEEEIYIRDYSVKVFGNSKTFEQMRSRILSVLYEYGDFPEKDTILEELNIVRNPGHVYFKGRGILVVGNQSIDISAFDGDIALSSKMLNQITEIRIQAARVVTIENLTTFNRFDEPDTFAVYLGGYHNRDRRIFIHQLYKQNPSHQYYHYGDIDAGGFYILLHLRKKTGVPFLPYRMDIPTLQACAAYTKPLTVHDEERLKKLLDTEFRDTVEYMLKHNCKLEQEALDLM